MRRWVREAVWIRALGADGRHRCERAGCRAVVRRENWEGHVHHLVYVKGGLERPEQLELLCLACHGAVHPHRRMLTREQQEDRCRSRREGATIHPGGKP